MQKEGQENFSFNTIKFSNTRLKQPQFTYFMKKLKMNFIKENFVLRTFNYPKEACQVQYFCRGKSGLYLIINEIT